MIGVRDVITDARFAFRHMASHTVGARLRGAGFLLMTRLAVCFAFAVRAMTGAAPQLRPRYELALAAAELLGMIGSKRPALTVVEEYGNVIGEKISGTIGCNAATGAYHASRAGEMALFADAVATGGFEFRGIDDVAGGIFAAVAHSRDVAVCRPMASFARHAILQKRRSVEAILSACDWLHLAGVTLQASLFHWLGNLNCGIDWIAR